MELIKRFALLILVLVCSAADSFADQTIVTVPSSDVLPGGEVILKQSNRFSPFGDSKFVSLTPTATIGLGRGFETSLGAGTNIDDHTSVKLNLGLKKVFKINRSSRFTIGGRISPSLTEGINPDSLIYAHGSYLIRETKTTLTSGMYISGDRRMPNSTGAILGIDQTIIPNKLRIVADWMSREDSGCALSAGFKIRPEPTTSITTAIVVPNSDEDRIAFSISISKYIGSILPERNKEENEKL